MDIEYSLLLALAFALGWWLATRVTTTLLHMTFMEILKDLGIKEDQLRDLARRNGLPLPLIPDTELPILEVRLEQHQGVIYAFRKDNDAFLGQGADREDLVKRLTENLSNVRVIISKEDGADLIQNG